TRAMRMGSHLAEPELALLALELPARFELEHPRNHAVPRMKHEHVERPLRTGAMGGGYAESGSWKKVCSCTLSQPRRAYSRIMRPDPIFPVPVSAGIAALACGVSRTTDPGRKPGDSWTVSSTRRFRSLKSQPP